jgi:hypothetical protein
VVPVDLAVAFQAVVQRNQARPLVGSVTTAVMVMAQVSLTLAVEGAVVVQTVWAYLVPPKTMAVMVAVEGPMTYLVHLWPMPVEAVEEAIQGQHSERQRLVVALVALELASTLAEPQGLPVLQIEAAVAVEVVPAMSERQAETVVLALSSCGIEFRMSC